VILDRPPPSADADCIRVTVEQIKLRGAPPGAAPGGRPRRLVAALDFFGQFREGRVSKSEVLQTGSSALRPSDDWIPVSPRCGPSVRNPSSQNLYHKPSRVQRETSPTEYLG
jgi:hypothetical protein